MLRSSETQLRGAAQPTRRLCVTLFFQEGEDIGEVSGRDSAAVNAVALQQEGQNRIE